MIDAIYEVLTKNCADYRGGKCHWPEIEQMEYCFCLERARKIKERLAEKEQKEK